MLLDFGAAWDENEADPIEVRVRPFDATDDEHITLPGSMPAGLRLHMWAVREASDGDPSRKLTYGELQAAGRFLFGAETFQRWLDQRITEDRLTGVVMSVISEYARREARYDPVSPGKAEGASAAPATSSATSEPSKPTSSAATASTSPETSGG